MSGRLDGAAAIDRDKPIAFQFNGRTHTGYAGDTLASALLANGVAPVARSFKYHRPRGIFSGGPEEPCAIVQLGSGAHTVPNARATMVELHDGLAAASQNCWPSVNLDIGALNNAASALLPAGFYNKTFMWPADRWMFYEHWIRKAAGLGAAPTDHDPDGYAHRWAHADVLVVGGGAAGLMAALAASAGGARVILAEQQAVCGGRLLDGGPDMDGRPAGSWVGDAVAALRRRDGVRLLTRTTVVGYYDGNFLTALERVRDHLAPGAEAHLPRLPRQRLWKIRAKQVVLATGAVERPLVFRDNDRPGVMLAGAVGAYVTRYGVLPGRRAVVLVNNDTGYAAALALRRAGAAVTVADLRADPAGEAVVAARDAGIRIERGTAVVATMGRGRLRGVQLAPLMTPDRTRSVAADLLAVAGGWIPSVQLFSQGRGRLRYDEDLGAFAPDVGPPGCRVVGACNGTLALSASLAEAAATGAAAARDAGVAGAARADDGGGEQAAIPAVAPPAEAPSLGRWIMPGAAAGKAFVDMHNDVTVADIALAVREGYIAVEHLKRYTTAGMGPDQGKTGNPNILAALAEALGCGVGELGHTTFRPPTVPVTLGAIAGPNIGAALDPARVTPMHDLHVAAGAAFEDVGAWKRPYAYPRGSESKSDAVARECRVVRDGVGLMDASTLGKIDLQGPDVAALLDRVYTNGWSTLAVGRCRYGLMLNEQGMIFDDGVTVRLAATRYHMTTTTGGAAHVLDWLEELLQTEWPDLRVFATSVTEQWAVAALCGPRARDVLATLTGDIDLDTEAFPFMSVREGHVAGVPARVFRISYTGELSYEVNVPADHGAAVWQALVEAGAAHDIAPFGTEAMHVLRAEKGFIMVGQETDGTVVPDDLGLGWAVSTRKDFIGRRSLSLPGLTDGDRKQLVGLVPKDGAIVLPEGAQIVDGQRAEPPMHAIGHVTSSYHSSTLGRSIALALLRRGRARHDEMVHVALLDGRSVPATVTAPVFYDPAGERMRG